MVRADYGWEVGVTSSDAPHLSLPCGNKVDSGAMPLAWAVPCCKTVHPGGFEERVANSQVMALKDTDYV